MRNDNSEFAEIARLALSGDNRLLVPSDDPSQVDYSSLDDIETIRSRVEMQLSSLTEHEREVLIASLSVSKKKGWENWGGNQTFYPGTVEKIESKNLASLVDIVTQALSTKSRVRVIGSGHSFSEIIRATNVFLYRSDSKYDGDKPIASRTEHRLLRKKPLFDVVDLACNAKISELNEALADLKLGFINFGSAVFQTLAGAVSTSTHGSGVGLGALCDSVLGILMVDGTGAIVFIEPSEGLTDPQAFEAEYGKQRRLVQCDDLFYSAVVSMGCMGIAVMMRFRVEPVYCLSETRRSAKWDDVKIEIRRGDHKLVRHYEVLINPYRDDKGNNCLVTTRVKVPLGTAITKRPTTRVIAEWLTSELRGPLVKVMNAFPGKIPRMLNLAFKGLVTKPGKPYIDYSHRVFDLGEVNNVRAVSSEIAFRTQDDEYILAVDEILKLAESNMDRGLYHTSPIALRFVAPSKAHFSMMYDRETCMVEIPLLRDTHGWEEILRSIEQASVKYRGRPHWGQWHDVTSFPRWLDDNYSAARVWRRSFITLNPSGVFDSEFTDRMGFRLPDHDCFALSKNFVLSVRKEGDIGLRTATIQALAETMIGDNPIIDAATVTCRSTTLLNQMDPLLSDNLFRALDVLNIVLPGLVWRLPPFHRLEFDKRVEAVDKCFRDDSVLARDLSKAIKLLTVFPYYSHEKVRTGVGYIPFEARKDTNKDTLTPLTYQRPD